MRSTVSEGFRNYDGRRSQGSRMYNIHRCRRSDLTLCSNFYSALH